MLSVVRLFVRCPTIGFKNLKLLDGEKFRKFSIHSILSYIDIE